MISENFTHNGIEFVATIERDEFMGAPWEECDCHGIVTDWTNRDKKPGEFILADNGRKKRFYDFAESVKIALRDGWGYAPGKLETCETSPGVWVAHFRNRGNGKLMNFEGKGSDVNSAISALYRAHQATMTKREYAARAAMADFEYLRRWCGDDWCYVTVTVRKADSRKCCGQSATLGGVESDGEYWKEVAQELAGELVQLYLQPLKGETK